MDYGTWRGLFTIVLLVLFIAIIFWSYSRRSKKAFDEAANSIFDEDQKSESVSQESESKKDE
ncbi:CcoQ/FixQ family Cbb3-type cytochrome c oxidase assembly chaperone [Idiomarina tyrosinivorans]|uniref:CcoQ/FixQ family Cbb3-type cytochrome c oxidase assembly chaperone n=1 Tax=Idiomarina tyrosinivorans TaxID=1445662 RepID=A0A432ZTV3_9GAMM|nr:cbb3-type cytochrome c oxidase subunit 3 [Idiomarina tyrosinivorans]RUO81319.1 CcoQ/FixQ family Cbb3-type cytochrome c oxidase assembly chaperone [Idiomarina tyrosinivorans]